MQREWNKKPDGHIAYAITFSDTLGGEDSWEAFGEAMNGMDKKGINEVMLDCCYLQDLRGTAESMVMVLVKKAKNLRYTITVRHANEEVRRSIQEEIDSRCLVTEGSKP